MIAQSFSIPDMDMGLPTPQHHVHVPKTLDQYPEQPSLQPAFTIPLAPLGFLVPGNSYLLRKETLVSLDFLDEDHLLFTFHVFSGLKSRDAGDNADDDKQQIQAEVLDLPGGAIETKTTWTVPDRSQYLWMLNDGDFLLRVPEGLDQGDKKLKTKSFLRLPGKLLWIQLDPNQQIMMTNSLEPGAAQEPATSSATVKDSTAASANQQKPADPGVLVIRTMKLATGDVMHVSRVPWTHQTDDWPMNSEGYVEKLVGKDRRWVLMLNSWSGKNWGIAGVDSNCPVKYNFVSDDELLVTSCDFEGGWSLQAYSSSGALLWKQKLAWNGMMPLLVPAPNGLRVARETMLLKRSIDHYKRLVGLPDLEGQMVRVFDTDNGKAILEAPLTPIFDGGGNVAISPSGQRVAIINAGAIQVFQLPPAHQPKGHPTTAGAASASGPPAR